MSKPHNDSPFNGSWQPEGAPSTSSRKPPSPLHPLAKSHSFLTDDFVVMSNDRTMVLVDMTDPNIRKNEPSGRFIGIDQALLMEAKGLCQIRRKEKSTHQQKQMLVEYLDPNLINSYGKFGTYIEKDALLGEKVGKWRIVDFQQWRDFSPNPKDIFSPLILVQDSNTKGMNKTKVAWIQDNFIVGGAELSSRQVIKVGINCGYLISLVTPSSDKSMINDILAKSDLIIINNIFGFSEPQMEIILRWIYAERKPYVKYEHDHREISRQEFARRLFRNSKLNVFLSPIHLKNHQDYLGCDGIVLPLAIDVDLFKPVEGVQRKPNTALVCNIRNFKSWKNLQKYIDTHPEITFTILAKNPIIQGSNVVIRDTVPYEMMPKIYSEHEFVVHLLDGWGAGERVIFEGALCGCKIIANDRVGHISWGKDLTDREGLRAWLNQAPYQFWREIERKVLC